MKSPFRKYENETLSALMGLIEPLMVIILLAIFAYLIYS